jgi:hypothetical protein
MLLVVIQIVRRSARYLPAFNPISLFPDISLDEILEIEFTLGMNLNIPYFDNIDWYEMEWKYNRFLKFLESKTQKQSNIADGTRF